MLNIRKTRSQNEPLCFNKMIKKSGLKSCVLIAVHPILCIEILSEKNKLHSSLFWATSQETDKIETVQFKGYVNLK